LYQTFRGRATLPELRVPGVFAGRLHRLPDARVLSFSLFGNDTRYVGALRNAELAASFYPGWTVRVYHDETVPGPALDLLRGAGADLWPVGAVGDGVPGTFWRFFVADDPNVEYFAVRDADSRPSLRERGAVDEWLASGRGFHGMRDSPYHGMPLMAGLWGAHRGEVAAAMASTVGAGRASLGIEVAAARYVRAQPDLAFSSGGDQFFLETEVWPGAVTKALVHDGHGCQSHRYAMPYPVARHSTADYLGRAYLADDTPVRADALEALPVPACEKQHAVTPW